MPAPKRTIPTTTYDTNRHISSLLAPHCPKFWGLSPKFDCSLPPNAGARNKAGGRCARIFRRRETLTADKTGLSIAYKALFRGSKCI